jgi:phosphoglucomutase
MDTHALSVPALTTALEVLAANAVDVMLDAGDGYTPTPVISHAIVNYNRGRKRARGRHRGHAVAQPARGRRLQVQPAQRRPGRHQRHRLDREARQPVAGRRRRSREPALGGQRARRAPTSPTATTTCRATWASSPRSSTSTRSAPPSSGSASIRSAAPNVGYWAPIAERYGLDVTIVNESVDATFRFMRLDWDGKIRMDCSSPYAMAGLVELKDRFDIAFGNDTDNDRHGIVARSVGLMNPNHYLCRRDRVPVPEPPRWRADAGIGKTLVSSSLIDRVAERLGRRLVEVPVGFKWFVDGLIDGSLGFGGEESAGASFLRKDGGAWSTDKDGIILDLLAAEITAKSGQRPGRALRRAHRELGDPIYQRIDAPATPAQKDLLKKLSPEQVTATELAGEPILAKLTARAGQRRRDRRAQGHHRGTAGSRRGPRAPRTSTRSTRRASAGDAR